VWSRVRGVKMGDEDRNCNEVHVKPARCGAKTRAGHPCGRYAMPNGRCRMHGGLSTGPQTLEGLERSRRSNWKHGLYSAEAKSRRRETRHLLHLMQELIDAVE
jgi:hypothetical protein